MHSMWIPTQKNNHGVLSIFLNNYKKLFVCTFTMLSKSYFSDVVEVIEACVLVHSLFVVGN